MQVYQEECKEKKHKYGLFGIINFCVFSAHLSLCKLQVELSVLSFFRILSLINVEHKSLILISESSSYSFKIDSDQTFSK